VGTNQQFAQHLNQLRKDAEEAIELIDGLPPYVVQGFADVMTAIGMAQRDAYDAAEVEQRLGNLMSLLARAAREADEAELRTIAKAIDYVGSLEDDFAWTHDTLGLVT
jgi:hypothetical protein